MSRYPLGRWRIHPLARIPLAFASAAVTVAVIAATNRDRGVGKWLAEGDLSAYRCVEAISLFLIAFGIDTVLLGRPGIRARWRTWALSGALLGHLGGVFVIYVGFPFVIGRDVLAAISGSVRTAGALPVLAVCTLMPFFTWSWLQGGTVATLMWAFRTRPGRATPFTGSR